MPSPSVPTTKDSFLLHHSPFERHEPNSPSCTLAPRHKGCPIHRSGFSRAPGGRLQPECTVTRWVSTVVQTQEVRQELLEASPPPPPPCNPQILPGDIQALCSHPAGFMHSHVNMYVLSLPDKTEMQATAIAFHHLSSTALLEPSLASEMLLCSPPAEPGPAAPGPQPHSSLSRCSMVSQEPLGQEESLQDPFRDQTQRPAHAPCITMVQHLPKNLCNPPIWFKSPLDHL